MSPEPRACAAEVCGKLVTAKTEGNLYDLSVEASVALGDLLALNTGVQAGTVITVATQLARPCYYSDPPTYFGAFPLLLCTCRRWVPPPLSCPEDLPGRHCGWFHQARGRAVLAHKHDVNPTQGHKSCTGAPQIAGQPWRQPG